MTSLTLGHRALVVAVVFALGLVTGCQALPDVKLGVCGNHVLEPSDGEDCDDGSAGCGAPSDSTRACRFVCSSVSACPTGWACGSDRVCRQPTGTYTLGPAIADARGSAGNVFGVSDVDGDGVPDLVVRGPSLVSLYRNDGTGHFTPLIAGSAPLIDPAAAASPELAVPRLGGALMASFGAEGVTVATWQDGSLDPWVLPTTVLPQLGPSKTNGATAQPTFIGVALQPPLATSVVLFLQDDTSPRQLVAYPLSTSLITPVLPLTSVAVPDRCVSAGRVVVRTGQAALAAPATLVAFDGSDTCVAHFDGGGHLTLQTLPTPATMTLTTRPALADVDGDGLFDVVDAVRLAGGDMAQGQNAELVWLQTTGGLFAAPVVAPITPVAPSDDGAPIGDGAIGVGQFAPAGAPGSAREDLVVAGAVLRNATVGSGAAFDATAGFVAAATPPVAESGPNSAAGDLNGDGLSDFVVWGSGLSVCFAVQASRDFSCAALSTSLSPSDTVLVGDVNGDGIADVIAVQHAEPGLVQVLLGHYRGPLSPAAVTPRAPHDLGLGGAAIWPAGSSLAGGVVVYVPTQGVASGSADANGVLAFNYPVAALDVAFADDADDLWIATETIDGGRVLRLPSGLITGAVEVPLGIDAVGARFAHIAPPRLYPLLIDAVTMPPFIGTTAPTLLSIQSAPTIVAYLPPIAPATSQLSVDLDGDGIDELLLERTTDTCSVRVLHWTANAQGDVDPSPAVIDTPLACSPLLVVDVPPLDGRLDLVTANGQATSPQASQLYRQLPDFTFVPEGTAPLTFVSDAPLTVVTTSFTEIASVDVNGDGVTDLVALGADSLPYVVFADVKRR